MLTVQNLLNKEKLKNETLVEHTNSLEQKLKEYENSFDIIQKQFSEKEKSIKELTSLNESAQNTLRTIPRVEDIISKIQPQVSEAEVQTSAIDLPLQITSIKQNVETLPASLVEISSAGYSPFIEKPTIWTKEKETKLKQSQILEVESPIKQSAEIQKKSQPKFVAAKADFQDFEDDLNLLAEDVNPIFSSIKSSQKIPTILQSNIFSSFIL